MVSTPQGNLLPIVSPTNPIKMTRSNWFHCHIYPQHIDSIWIFVCAMTYSKRPICCEFHRWFRDHDAKIRMLLTVSSPVATIEFNEFQCAKQNKSECIFDLPNDHVQLRQLVVLYFPSPTIGVHETILFQNPIVLVHICRVHVANAAPLQSLPAIAFDSLLWSEERENRKITINQNRKILLCAFDLSIGSCTKVKEKEKSWNYRWSLVLTSWDDVKTFWQMAQRKLVIAYFQ